LTFLTTFKPHRLFFDSRVALIAALALGLAAPVQAQDKASRSALIVGVGTYSVPEIPPLPGVAVDMASARAIANAMGIADQRITVLRDAQATKQGVLDALEQLAASTTEGGRVFIYFSGHGTRWYEPTIAGCKEGLLSFDYKTIANEEIAQRTRRISEVADKVVVLFDACHSDGVSGSRARNPAVTRSIASGAVTAKFFLKGGADADACAKPSNVKTRGLLAESTRLGALSENFVQITSSRADEVSFDSDKGGLATQAVRDCLLGKAVDRDGSGAVAIHDVEHCAQQIVEDKLKPFPDLKPHHITVTGNRNIVPVAVLRPPAPTVVAVASSANTAAPTSLASPAPSPTVPAVLPSVPAVPPAVPAASPVTPAVVTAVVATPTPATQPVVAPAPPPVAAPTPPPVAFPAAPPVAPPVQPVLASLATLRIIEQQSNPRRKVEVVLSRNSLKIGKDPLALTVKSSHDGYVHMVLLGSDRKSFYLLFPNGLDSDNRIRANQRLSLPRPDWKLVAQGPAGTDQLLVLVSDTPRDLKALTASLPDAAAPFTFSLNDLPGRAALIDFFAGRGVTGGSESFGAKLLSIQETP
jgi:hypothetical protein